MIKPKKIIHLTDLHIGYEDDEFSCYQNVRKVKAWIMANCKPRCEYVIVITGDLIDNANKDDLWDLSAEFIRELSNPDESGEKYDIVLVPGNHDYGTGSLANPEFVPVFKKRYFADSNFEYPFVKIIGDGIKNEKIAFICLDSNEEEMNCLDRLLAQGEIGKKQRDLLKNRLDSIEVKECAYRIILLHHHPFESWIFKFYHWLKDRRKLKMILKAAMNKGIKINALLFGHNHGGKSRHKKWNIPRVYDGGTTGGKRKPSFIRIIEDLSSEDTSLDKKIDFSTN